MVGIKESAAGCIGVAFLVGFCLAEWNEPCTAYVWSVQGSITEECWGVVEIGWKNFINNLATVELCWPVSQLRQNKMFRVVH